MSTHMQGLLSLIQYCPNAAAAEGANVGLLLVCPQKGIVRLKMASRFTRARERFRHSSVDTESLKVALNGLKLEVEQHKPGSIDDVLRLSRRMANKLTILAPRDIATTDIDRSFAKWFEDYVEANQDGVAIERPPRRRAVKGFRQAFRDLMTRTKKIAKAKPVEVPVLQTPFLADYEYTNGSQNLVKQHVFDSNAPRVLATAQNVATPALLLRKEAKYAITLVIEFIGNNTAQSKRVRDLLRDHEANVVPRTEIPRLVADIESELASH
jgi:hypothetical protein